MPWLFLVVTGSLSISFICTLMESVMLHSSLADIDLIKKNHPRAGERLEALHLTLDDTISTIIALNTAAITLGAVAAGALSVRVWGEISLGALALGLTLAVLIFCEVLPRNLGVAHKYALLPMIATPLTALYRVLKPAAALCNLVVRFFIPLKPTARTSEQQIILLAERGAKEGTLTRSESSIIANALTLDDVRVSELMTPRSVITAIRKSATVGEVFREYPNIPFGRMPVYGKHMDDIVGIVRRRDLLKAKANDQDLELVGNIMQEVNFIPETVTASHALQLFLKTHQQFAVAVDEFGSTAGVLTMEDIMEHIPGKKIFEKDDLPVHLRQLPHANLT